MTLKIGVILWPGIANRCALDEICSERGYLIDATRMACDLMDLNCSFVWYNSSDYGDADENGVGTGLVGAIQRGEFDTSIPTLAPNYHRFKAISFAGLFDVDDIILATRAPTLENDLDWTIVSAFHWKVWISFFVLLLSVACLLTVCFLLHKSLYKDIPLNKATTSNTFFRWSLSLITIEFKDSLLKFNSIRLLIGVWIFGTVVLSSAYTSKLFSGKIFIENKLPYTDLETFVQCLESSKCRIISSTLSVNALLTVASPEQKLGQRIRTSWKYNPVRITPVDEILRAILEEESQYLVSVMSKNRFLALTNRNRDCLYYATDLNYHPINTFPFAKNSTYAKTLNKIAQVFREYDLGHVLKQKYFQKSLCTAEWKFVVRSSSQTEKITLILMETTLLFYALATIFAICVFAVELLASRFWQWLRKFKNRTL